MSWFNQEAFSKLAKDALSQAKEISEKASSAIDEAFELPEGFENDDGLGFDDGIYLPVSRKKEASTLASTSTTITETTKTPVTTTSTLPTITTTSLATKSGTSSTLTTAISTVHSSPTDAMAADLATTTPPNDEKTIEPIIVTEVTTATASTTSTPTLASTSTPTSSVLPTDTTVSFTSPSTLTPTTPIKAVNEKMISETNEVDIIDDHNHNSIFIQDEGESDTHTLQQSELLSHTPENNQTVNMLGETQKTWEDKIDNSSVNDKEMVEKEETDEVNKISETCETGEINTIDKNPIVDDRAVRDSFTLEVIEKEQTKEKEIDCNDSFKEENIGGKALKKDVEKQLHTQEQEHKGQVEDTNKKEYPENIISDQEKDTRTGKDTNDDEVIFRLMENINLKEKHIEELLLEATTLNKKVFFLEESQKKLKQDLKEKESEVQNFRTKLVQVETRQSKLVTQAENFQKSDIEHKGLLTELRAKYNQQRDELVQSIQDVQIFKQKLSNTEAEKTRKVSQLENELKESQKEVNNLKTQAVIAKEISFSSDIDAREEAQNIALQESNQLKLEIEDLMQRIKKLEIEKAKRESQASHEVKILRKKIVREEARNQTLIDNMATATKPLLKELEEQRLIYESQILTNQKNEDNLKNTIENLTVLLEEAKQRADQESFIASQVKRQFEDQSGKLKENELALNKVKLSEKLSMDNLLSTSQTKENLENELRKEQQKHRLQIHDLNENLEELSAKLQKSELAREQAIADLKNIQSTRTVSRTASHEDQEKEKEKIQSRRESKSTADQSLHANQMEHHEIMFSAPSSRKTSLMNTKSMDLQFLGEERENNNLYKNELDPVAHTAPTTPSGSDATQSSRFNFNPSSGPTDELGAVKVDSLSGSQQQKMILRQREGEIHSLQVQLKELQASYEVVTEQFANIGTQKYEESVQQDTFQEYEDKIRELENKNNIILQMYGQKAEEADELKMDLADIKQIYQSQIEQLVTQLDLQKQK